jgi:hypothetical protein
MILQRRRNGISPYLAPFVILSLLSVELGPVLLSCFYFRKSVLLRNKAHRVPRGKRHLCTIPSAQVLRPWRLGTRTCKKPQCKTKPNQTKPILNMSLSQYVRIWLRTAHFSNITKFKWRDTMHTNQPSSKNKKKNYILNYQNTKKPIPGYQIQCLQKQPPFTTKPNYPKSAQKPQPPSPPTHPPLSSQPPHSP